MQHTVTRCAWAQGAPEDYMHYHDEEWGVPVHDDKTHFEFLTLEGAQAGLSWLTVLRKRKGYRQAFAQFDIEKIAAFTPQTCQRLYSDTRIVRNRLKIQATVRNAQCFLEIQAACGSFDQYIWSFTDGQPRVNQWRHSREVPANTPLSDQISKDLKRRGFQFIGSTIIYAYMQAVGLVNDHTVNCFRHQAAGLIGP
ncbi:MAG: DNA-3-methyladenine glycosylase I [Bacteroidota bacterium]